MSASKSKDFASPSVEGAVEVLKDLIDKKTVGVGLIKLEKIRPDLKKAVLALEAQFRLCDAKGHLRQGSMPQKCVYEEKIEALKKWLDKIEQEIDKQIGLDKKDFESGKDRHVDLVRYDKNQGKKEVLEEVLRELQSNSLSPSQTKSASGRGLL